jgi:hypothetical protein
MKTDQLIDMLSTNVEPVKSGQPGGTLAWALVIGGAASFCVMLTTVGLRTDATGGIHMGFLALKVLFMLSLIGFGTALLTELIRLGQDGRKLFTLLSLLFLAAGFAGVVALALEPSTAWDRMILGTQRATCLFCIRLFAIIPFAVLIWALRKGAPTNLKRTGSIAGLVAGALSNCLCVSLRRRFSAVYRDLVRSDGCALHLDWLSARAAASALVISPLPLDPPPVKKESCSPVEFHLRTRLQRVCSP